METKFIIKDKVLQTYYRAAGEGQTKERSEAYQYSREEIIHKSYFDKTEAVLIPVTQSKSTLYRVQVSRGKHEGKYDFGGLLTTERALATLYTKEEFLTKFNPYHFKAIPVNK
jgi:hypothetical protein